ncbi:MAG: hypothetical protein ACK5MW_04160 [Enterococcus sp.]
MRVAIIPSAISLNEELKERFGDVPNVLVPLEEKPILDYIVKNIGAQVDQLVVVTNQDKYDLVSEYIVNNNLVEQVSVVKMINSKSIAETVATGLTFAREQFGVIDSLIINFGDTFVDEGLNYSGNNIVFSDDLEKFKWSTFEFNQNGQITKVIDKEQVHSNGIENHLFIGVFTIDNVNDFSDLLSQKFVLNGEPFFFALMEYSKKNPFQFLYTEHWIDAGHLERYIESKKSVKARSFNTIQIDHKRGILTKRSNEVEKFLGEIKWYLKLPTDVQYLAPRIYDYSLSYENPHVKMEYYSYSTLHELFLWSDLSMTDWEKIFDNLLFVLDDLNSYTKQLSSEEFRTTLYDMYYTKTLDRIEKVKEHSEFSEIYYHPTMINGKQYQSIQYYLEYLEELLEVSGIYSRASLGIIHGDYCAPNILIDKKTNIIRLIDPRGKFGNFDIYGDSIYDIAKLMHSFDGHYDFLISDQFNVSYDNKQLIYKVHTNDKHKLITESLMTRIKARNTTQYHQAKLIQALLFLSMVPLHSDYPSRQYMMLATGIRLMDESFQHYFKKEA